MAVIMSLCDFNEFIRDVGLMEAAVEGLARGHNKWKALISTEWAEKKTPFILVSILLCSFMGRCSRDGGARVPVPLAGREWSAARRWRSVWSLRSSTQWIPQSRLDSWITFWGTGSFTPAWPRAHKRGVGVLRGVPRPGAQLGRRDKHWEGTKRESARINTDV